MLAGPGGQLIRFYNSKDKDKAKKAEEKSRRLVAALLRLNSAERRFSEAVRDHFWLLCLACDGADCWLLSNWCQ